MSFDYGKPRRYERPNTDLFDKALEHLIFFVEGIGDEAFVRLRTWEWFKPNPVGAPTGKVLHRGDLVVAGFTQVAPDGTRWLAVESPRRDIRGLVPKDSLSKQHPLQTLADNLWLGVIAQVGAEKKFDAAFNEVSCTKGAFKIQNWLRGHVDNEGVDRSQPGPFGKLKAEKTMADQLRRLALKGEVLDFYRNSDGTRVTDPDLPALTWLWPGDVATFSRSRYWDPKSKSLKIVPYGRAKKSGKRVKQVIADIGILNTNFNKWHDVWPSQRIYYDWSGHAITLIGFEFDEGAKSYTRFITLEAHMGGASGGETKEEDYSRDEFLFWGVNRWGMVPVLVVGRSIAVVRKAAHKAWSGKFWSYHKEMARNPTFRKTGDPLDRDGHAEKALELLEQAAKQRGLPTPKWDVEPAKDEVDGLRTAGSGLECFGFAFWKD